MDGKEKFQIVKDVVESIVRKLPQGTLVGMRVYGHRTTALDGVTVERTATRIRVSSVRASKDEQPPSAH